MEGLHLGASCCHLFPASLIEPLYSFSFCSTPILAILSFPLRMHSTLDKLTASYGSEVSLRNHARVEESPSLESHTEVGTWYQKNRLLFCGNKVSYFFRYLLFFIYFISFHFDLFSFK
jgi:hypothetical protein